MIARATGRPVSITGLGWYVPDKVVTNDDLAKVVDTSDEWIMTRTGIRERRMVEDDVAMSDISLPAARAALAQAGLEGKDIDLIIVATITPDMAFPATAGLVADQLGSVDAAAYDLSAGCTGFMYALAQAHAAVSCRPREARARDRRRRSLEGARLDGPLDARPLRRRCGRSGARARRRGRLPRLRARRRRLGRRRAELPRERLARRP